MKNQEITITTLILVVSCFAFLPQMRALSPPPDGCYPEFTTAEGCNALQNLTSGAGNTGLGWFALFGTSTGNFNTAVGAGTLVTNNSDSNTAVGAAALLLNTAGTENSALGTGAMVNNDNGTNNTGVGAFALQNNTNGNNNTAVGHAALQNATGDFNNALGAGAGTDPDIGSNNVYIGDPGFPGDENVLSIGGIAASGVDYENTYIGGIYGASVNQAAALAVYVDTDGHLGTNLVNASGKKIRIRSPKGAQHAKVNEFQKQQKRIAELESTVARQQKKFEQQQKQIELLTAGLQKVSAQLETSNAAPHVVVNNP